MLGLYAPGSPETVQRDPRQAINNREKVGAFLDALGPDATLIVVFYQRVLPSAGSASALLTEPAQGAARQINDS